LPALVTARRTEVMVPALICNLFYVAIVARAQSPADKASELLVKMTLEEKVQLLHGGAAPGQTRYVGNTPEIVNETSGVRIPPLNLNDGPQGYRGGGATCWPSTLTVGATWDRSLVSAWGTAMAREFYGKGANVLLGPGLCVSRVPNNGRNFEYISGEDPYLGWALAQPLVKGIQSQNVIANAKHYIMNNQESNRHGDTAVVDERTRFEIYYPPFEGAIDAGIGSAMCSYNLIQADALNQTGNWSCENSATLKVDLKERLGFKGWVMSDWGATHSTSISRGLDQEMPGGGHMGDALLRAVRAGEIPETEVDESVLRILTPMFRLGLFDHYTQWVNESAHSATVTSREHSALARELASAATVLLKNDGVLPIDFGRVRSIAVVGSNGGDRATISGGGSGAVGASYVVSPHLGISERFARGPGQGPATPVCTTVPDTEFTDLFLEPKSVRAATSAGDCCEQCFADRDCSFFTFTGTGMPVHGQSDVATSGGASVTANPLLALRSGGPGTRSAAQLLVPLTPGIEVDGISFTYRYITGYAGHAGQGSNFSVRVAGQVVYSSPHLNDYSYDDNRTNYSAPVRASATGLAIKVPSAGVSDIAIEFDSNDRNVQLLLPLEFDISCNGAVCASACWFHGAMGQRQNRTGFVSGSCGKAPPTPSAVSYYGGSDPAQVAALAAAADLTIALVGTSSKEGTDRGSLAFPSDQDAMVAAATAAAPGRIVVVALNPGAVLMPWADNASAVLTMFLPGLEVGHALADVLFGDVNPTGRLPVTFPNVENEMRFTPEQYRFDTHWQAPAMSIYSEQLEVGYRWYNSHNVAPKFPFGHGLSYASFEFSALTISLNAVSIDVVNSGAVPGAEVMQLYLTFPDAAQEPPRQLKGFVKTEVLQPGASVTVHFALRDRDFSIWDVVTHSWQPQQGEFLVEVGRSSQDLPVQGALQRPSSRVV